MDFLKGVAGKIVTGIVALAVVVGAISWWSMDQPQRDEILASVARVGGWVGVVLLLPWALFWLIRWVARMDSNAAGAVLVISLTLVELTALAWLFEWTLFGSALGWVYLAFGTLIAGVYNLFTCDWIAEQLE